VNTFQALAVTLLAVLPGASYTFAYERVVGAFGVSLSDRLVRFTAASAIFHALLSGPELDLYREFVSSGRLGRGDVEPWLFQLIVMTYVFLPTAAGSFLGHGRRRGWQWVLWLTGASTEPRAWDYLWRREGVTLIVRLKLKSGAWLGGFFGNVPGSPGSYAAGYPEAQDLFLGVQVQVDPETGAFERDADGRVQPVPSKSGLLVRWDEIEYIDVLEV
jgi:Family of unknown function (DUF6338)